jgi:GntR family transcriptional regulator, transcriptional repressor for pyruvate dehydrogenase complex
LQHNPTSTQSENPDNFEQIDRFFRSGGSQGNLFMRHQGIRSLEPGDCACCMITTLRDGRHYSMFEKVSAAPTLSDQVAQALLARIESGQLKPGEKLPPEAVLSPEFGVSRTVVREAISRLKQGGLLESRQGSGVFVSLKPAVSPLKIDDSVIESREAVLQIVELRRAIESEAAAVAAQRRSSSQLAEIETAFHAIDAEVAAGGDGVEADVGFHRAIARATGNRYFLKTLEFLSQYLTAATRMTRANEARRIEFMRQVRDEHNVIVEAIRRQDAMAARNAAAAHMFNAARRLATAEFQSS